MDSSYKILVDAKLNASTLNKQLKQYQDSIKGIKITADTSGVDKLNSKVKQSTSLFSQLTNGIGDTALKVAKFGMITSVIDAFTTSVTSSVQAVFELNKSMIEFQKVSDLTGDAMNNYIDKAADMGETLAKSASQMIDAATEFRKNSYNDQDSLTLATVAEKFTNIADEEISAGESASFLISQMKAFKISAQDAEHIIDATNETANQFSVGTGDIEKGLVAAGSAMSTYGNSFEQVIGLVTSG